MEEKEIAIICEMIRDYAEKSTSIDDMWWNIRKDFPEIENFELYDFLDKLREKYGDETDKESAQYILTKDGVPINTDTSEYRIFEAEDCFACETWELPKTKLIKEIKEKNGEYKIWKI